MLKVQFLSLGGSTTSFASAQDDHGLHVTLPSTTQLSFSNGGEVLMGGWIRPG